MVCLRCKIVVDEELRKLNLNVVKVELGEAEIKEVLSLEQIQLLQKALLKFGLELIEDKQSILIEKIKITISELISLPEEQLKMNVSSFLSQKLQYNYTYLTNVFSKNQGVTIKKYFITNKIEKVKQLLCYDELNLTEIAYKLRYASVGHLSNQFKKVTGVTPSYFKRTHYREYRNRIHNKVV